MAIKIGEDTFEIQNNGTYFINGEPNINLTDTTNLSGHKMSHAITVEKHFTRTLFTISLDDNVSLEVARTNSYGRDAISFEMNGVHEHRMSGGTSLSDCVGLASTWDHPDDEENRSRHLKFLIGRSGTAYSRDSAVDFGPEWQVDLTKGDPMIFVEDVGQQLPDQACIDSPLQTKDQRRLRALYEEDGGDLSQRAEEACDHLGRGSDLFDACFYDVLVTGDVTFAAQPWYNK